MSVYINYLMVFWGCTFLIPNNGLCLNHAIKYNKFMDVHE